MRAQEQIRIEQEKVRLERMREQAEIASRELISMRELQDSEQTRETRRKKTEMETRRRIAREWQMLKMETEEERADIINQFKSGCREENQLCREMWTGLKSKRTAARAVLLKEWRSL